MDVKMFVTSKSENALKETFCVYFTNNGPSISATAPDRTSSREIGFQLARRTFEIAAPIGATERDQTRKGKVCFAILK